MTPVSTRSSSRRAPRSTRRCWAGRAWRRAGTSGCCCSATSKGLDSERAIAWRAADSLSVRGVLQLELQDPAPDHSTISRTRRLIDLETHTAVFTWVLQRLAEAGLVTGTTVGIDATTLEANAALRNIVRRDTGESYEAFLTQLAEASGIATPTRTDLARLDRTRKKKGANKDWTHPDDPDARITKMKDGRTHLAHKAEHAVDLDTGAVVGVTVQPADAGDTQTLAATVCTAAAQIETVQPAADAVRGTGRGQGLSQQSGDAGPRGGRRPRLHLGARPRAVATGAVRPRPAMRSIATADAFEGPAGNGCCANAVNAWNVRLRISSKPVGCGVCTCAGIPTSSSGCSCTPPVSTSGC